MKPKNEGIIFDLIGVLLEFCGPKKIFELSKGRIGFDVFNKFWTESKWAVGFSKGTCFSEDFAKGAFDYFNLDIVPEEFIENYKSWYVGPYPGAIDLVCELRKRFKVGCLSNTN